MTGVMQSKRDLHTKWLRFDIAFICNMKLPVMYSHNYDLF